MLRKELFKQTMLELVQGRKDLFAQVIKDLALANAIKEGEATESVSREQVFQILEVAPARTQMSRMDGFEQNDGWRRET